MEQHASSIECSDKAGGERPLFKAERVKNIISTVLFCAVVVGLAVFAIVRKPDSVSLTERRDLASRPKLSVSSVASGAFFKGVETYLEDQFPFRDSFKTLAAISRFYVFNQSDNHGVYIKEGVAVSLNTGMRADTPERLSRKINKVNAMWFVGDASAGAKSPKTYFSIIPDKGYWLDEKVGYPQTDYSGAVSSISQGSPDCAYISIFDTLNASNYYKTDSHWSQECLIPTATRLLTDMGRTGFSFEGYSVQSYYPFYGVYYGQSSLPLSPDTINCVTDDVTASAVVKRAVKGDYSFENASIYYPSMISAPDAYDIYFGGACTVISMENPLYTEDERVLYLFGDSYARSIAPLLLHGYSRVYVIDIRYTRASTLSNYIDFSSDCDVLYLYCAQTIDQSSQLNTD